MSGAGARAGPDLPILSGVAARRDQISEQVERQPLPCTGREPVDVTGEVRGQADPVIDARQLQPLER